MQFHGLDWPGAARQARPVVDAFLDVTWGRLALRGSQRLLEQGCKPQATHMRWLSNQGMLTLFRLIEKPASRAVQPVDDIN